MRPLTLLSALLGAAILVLAWILAGGASGWLYVAAYALVAAAGLPAGFALFGRRHAAGWIAGGVLGYGLTAFVWGLAVQAGIARAWVFPLLWIALGAALWFSLRRAAPAIVLPAWTRRHTAALLLTLMVVPAIAGPAFARIGDRDSEGRLRYRAYFTADYLWHVALTAELAKLDSPPRNPYLAKQPLHYYWTYFNVPAALSVLSGRTDRIDRHLALNALCAGLLFVSAIFLAAWVAVPRAGPVAAGVILAVTSASAEGAFAISRFLARGQPLDGLRDLNIDAITAWWFSTLTIDGLPRSLWYTPQHAFACAASLVALAIAASREVRRPVAASLTAGVALGLALVSSPFLGGVFSLVYGVSSVWVLARQPRFVARVLIAALAGVPVALALLWCVLSGTFEGAGGAVAVGLSRQASRAPGTLLALALGPMLVAAIGGLAAGRGRGWAWQPAIVSLAAGLFMLFFVTLTLEPIWIGWRAGQILLITMPALAAALFAALSHRRVIAAAVFLVIAAVGLPTTLIDLRNASDVDHTAMGPGFRWTVVVPGDTEDATAWIRRETPPDAIVQMSIEPRGRETWTLIPTFAQRRMAAGQPISLMRMPAYDEASQQADAMYRTGDAAEAWRLARRLGIGYIYLDAVERQAFGAAAMDKFRDSRYFTPVFWKADAEVIQVK